MQLDMDLNLKQEQNLVMTPQLKMAIKILQYNSLELKKHVEREIEENPLLEILESEGIKYTQQDNYTPIKKDRIEYENFVEYRPDFYEYLENQLFEVLTKEEIEIGKYLIGSLNSNRELTLEFEEISTILSDSNINISPNEIKEIYTKIEKLDLNYNENFSNNSTQYIVPDFILKNENGKFKIVPNQNVVPSLKISSYYYNLLKNNDDSDIKEYLKEKYKSALWLIKSIEQRENTIKKVIKAIIKKQNDFLKKGFKFLYTMSMEEVAEIIDMHVSTVSRATTEKYLQTPYGLFNLKFFFNSGIDKFSSVSIKAIISEEIALENKNSPLSDNKLADVLLKKYAFEISRRTIAKYRKSIGIPSSRARKN
jgi:RNA polymerase sigma-54 factor